MVGGGLMWEGSGIFVGHCDTKFCIFRPIHRNIKHKVCHSELTSGSNFPVRDISQLVNAASTILFTVSCVSSPLITAASPSPMVWRMVWVEWRMWVNMVASSVRDTPSSSFRLKIRKRSIQRSWNEPWSTTARPHTNSSKLILPF